MAEAATLQQALRRFAPQRLDAHRLRVCEHLMSCHTAALGQVVYHCPSCKETTRLYPGCGDRHCPQCQGKATRAWIQRQQMLALPVPYHHLVFTLPHSLNGWAQLHPAVLYRLLFQCAWSTLKAFGQHHRRAGGQLGMIAVLHTWGQTLVQHIHLHCLIPSGTLGADGVWQPIRGKYLFPVRALSRRFRGAMVAGLRQCYRAGELHRIRQADEVDQKLDELMAREWVVYNRPCLNQTASVVAYLGRYTRRIAISNHRILKVTDETVSFRYKDYADDDQPKVMELQGAEFIRRFLLHILPKGFMRVRHYGFLANRCRKQKLERIRQAIGAITPVQTEEPEPTALHCPHCHESVLVRIGRIHAPRPVFGKPGRRR